MLWCNSIHKYNTIIFWLGFTTGLWCNCDIYISQYIYIYWLNLTMLRESWFCFWFVFVFFCFWCFRLNAILKKFIQQLFQPIIIFAWINRPDTSLCPVFCTFHVKLCYHFFLGMGNLRSKLKVLTCFGDRWQREQTYTYQEKQLNV